MPIAQPLPWDEVEETPEYKAKSRVDRLAVFQEWDGYAQQYAQENALWDKPGFQEDYANHAREVTDSLHKGGSWGAAFDRSAVNSYNLVKNTAKAAYRGWLEGDVAVEMQKPNPDIKKISDLQVKIAENTPSEDFTKAWDEKVDPKESFAAFRKDPVGNIAQLLSGALGAQTRTSLSFLHKIPEKATQGLVGGAVIGAAAAGVGAVPGGIMGLGVGAQTGFVESQMLSSYANEYSGSIISSLQEADVDVKNEKQLREAMDDKQKMASIRSKAQKKGVPIGIVDGLFATFAGNMFSQPAKKLIGKSAQWAAEAGMQMIGDVGGEALSQVTSEGKITSMKSMAAEGIAGVSSTAIETGVGKATKALINMKPEERDQLVATKQLAPVLEENNAPLTAQALVQKTTEDLTQTAEDPTVVAEILEEQAPEGTFVDQEIEDEQYAPPTESADIDPTSPAPLTEAAVAEEPAAEQLDSEPGVEGAVQEAVPAAAEEVAVLPAGPAEPGPVEEVQPAVPGSKVVIDGKLSAEIAAVRRDGKLVVKTSTGKGYSYQAVEPSRVSPESPAVEQVIPTVIPPWVEDMERVENVTRDPQPLQNEPTTQQITPDINPTLPGDVVQTTDATGIVPAVKPKSQSPDSFTPEQNVSHETFISQPEQQEDPVAVKEFSDWAAINTKVAVLKSGDHRAVITKSSKPDRKYQVTFMDTGIDGIPEAFHDEPADSIEEAITKAHKKGFTDTSEHQKYGKPTATATAKRSVGQGSPSQDLKGITGRRPGELPGIPEAVRQEVPAGTNEEQLDRHAGIAIEAPAGATFIRATDTKGRASEEPIKTAGKGLNSFQGAGPWVKIEAGTRDAKGKFVPMEGPVVIRDRAQVDIERKAKKFPTKQQAKAAAAMTLDESPDPYQGVPLTDRAPMEPGQNRRLLNELSRIGALDDAATGQTVLEFLVSDKQSPGWVKSMAGLLAKAGANNVQIQASHRPQSTWSALYVGHGGPDRAEVGTIMFNTAQPNPGAGLVFLHEVAHHVTLSKILGKVDLSKTEQTAMDNLQQIFENVSQRPEFHGEYGLQNIGEFVSEVFSNAGFRTKLDNITAQGDKVSIFQRVYNSLARLLFNRAVTPGSMLDEAMRNSLDLAGAPIAETRGAIGLPGRLDALFNPNASAEAQAMAVGRLFQDVDLAVISAPEPSGPKMVDIHSVNRNTKEITTTQAEATVELERSLKVHEGIYQQLIKCI